MDDGRLLAGHGTRELVADLGRRAWADGWRMDPARAACGMAGLSAG